MTCSVEGEDEEGSGSGSGSEGDADEANGDVDMDEDKPAKKSDPNDISAFKMDQYDEEESKGVAMGAFANVKGLSFYRDNNEDPYITLKEVSWGRRF